MLCPDWSGNSIPLIEDRKDPRVLLVLLLWFVFFCCFSSFIVGLPKDASEQGRQRRRIILMAVFVVTKEDVLSCANELGIPEEEITEDVIELVKEEVSQGIQHQRGIIRGMVKEAIECPTGVLKEAAECPLGMVCSPSCPWQEVGECVSPKLRA